MICVMHLCYYYNIHYEDDTVVLLQSVWLPGPRPFSDLPDSENLHIQ